MIEEIDPPIAVKLYDVTWVHCEPRLSLEVNNITAPDQCVGGLFECSTVENTVCSIKYLRSFPWL